MRYDTAKIVVGIGAVLFVLGAILGLVPQSAQGVSCGSPFLGGGDATAADFTDAMMADSQGLLLDEVGTNQAACDDRLGQWRTITWLLVGAGVGLWVVSIVVKPTTTAADLEAADDE